jgi:hypothetical protein
MPDKPSFDEYKAWCVEALGINLDDPRFKLFYDLNVGRVLSTAQEHPFFLGADEFLSEACLEYDAAGPFGLLMGKNEIQLVTKPFDSVINKSYRKNIAFNDRYPRAPREGWLVPDNWFSSLDDLIRGTIVTKYIDGPEFLSKRLTDLAKRLSLDSLVSSRESDSGYYAYHFSLKMPVQVAQIDMTPIDLVTSVEIQITTQLQEILRKLTHGLYEELRIDPRHDKRAWKWDFGSSRFQASYLGHTLHMLEGMIVQLKNKALAETKAAVVDIKGDAE